MVDILVNQYNENPTITENRDNEALIAVVPECLYIPTNNSTKIRDNEALIAVVPNVSTFPQLQFKLRQCLTIPQGYPEKKKAYIASQGDTFTTSLLFH